MRLNAKYKNVKEIGIQTSKINTSKIDLPEMKEFFLSPVISNTFKRKLPMSHSNSNLPTLLKIKNKKDSYIHDRSSSYLHSPQNLEMIENYSTRFNVKISKIDLIISHRKKNKENEEFKGKKLLLNLCRLSKYNHFTSSKKKLNNVFEMENKREFPKFNIQTMRIKFLHENTNKEGKFSERANAKILKRMKNSAIRKKIINSLC